MKYYFLTPIYHVFEVGKNNKKQANNKSRKLFRKFLKVGNLAYFQEQIEKGIKTVGLVVLSSEEVDGLKN